MKKIIPLLLLLTLINLSWNYYNYSNMRQIFYVDSSVLIYQFEGTIDAQKKLETVKAKWQANIDTLNSEIQIALKRYELDFPKLTALQKEQHKNSLAAQNESAQRYIQSIQEKITVGENDLLKGALNQINAYSLKFGKEKKYDLILGTTQNGNVVYGSESVNITKELLEYMNQQYNDE